MQIVEENCGNWIFIVNRVTDKLVMVSRFTRPDIRATAVNEIFTHARVNSAPLRSWYSIKNRLDKLLHDCKLN